METLTSYKAIGLMSGTSLDGLDLALLTFTQQGNTWKHQIVFAETYPFPNQLLQLLKNPFTWVGTRISEVDALYTQFVAHQVQEALSRNPSFQPDFIASHGQTVYHQPANGFTTQIGNGAQLAAKTGIACISDFRSADVALGGQGAPLVPVGDHFLFGEYDSCLNIGGFANVSFSENNQRMAFDIVAANFVLNELAQQLGKPFDENGAFASSGVIVPELLQELNGFDFYHQTPPKSLGSEFVNQAIFPLLEKWKKEESLENLISTFTEHIALQIAAHLPMGNCLVTGGGAKNQFLIQRLRSLTSTEITVPTDEIIDFKEALIFGFLGVLRWKNEINVWASVTGAKRNHCAGSVHL